MTAIENAAIVGSVVTRRREKRPGSTTSDAADDRCGVPRLPPADEVEGDAVTVHVQHWITRAPSYCAHMKSNIAWLPGGGRAGTMAYLLRRIRLVMWHARCVRRPQRALDAATESGSE